MCTVIFSKNVSCGKRQECICRSASDEDHGLVSYSSDIERGVDLFETMDHGEKILSMYSSGGVFHLGLSEEMNGKDLCLFLKKIISAYDIPYIGL